MTRQLETVLLSVWCKAKMDPEPMTGQGAPIIVPGLGIWNVDYDFFFAGSFPIF